jgi:Glyoxalase/Bleomycin resistance protein/Dioxygenase superfamily
VSDFVVPRARIMQTSYVVADVRAAAAEFSEVYGVGPWMVVGSSQLEDVRYRGAPGSFDVSVAATFAGDMMLELVAPNDESPSVFQEVIERSGYGFHHVALATETFSATVEQFRARGHEVVFEARSSAADGGTRVAFLDRPDALPGMLEIMELDPGSEEAYAAMHAMSRQWDGREPVREMDQPG